MRFVPRTDGESRDTQGLIGHCQQLKVSQTIRMVWVSTLMRGVRVGSDGSALDIPPCHRIDETLSCLLLT